MEDRWALKFFLSAFSQMTTEEVSFLDFLNDVKFFEGMSGVEKNRFASKLYGAEQGIKDGVKQAVGAEGLKRIKAIIGANGEFFNGTRPIEKDNLMLPQQRSATLELLFNV